MPPEFMTPQIHKVSMTRPGEEAWKAHTTPFDRVRSVVQTVSEPRSTEYIAEEAAVSVEVAADHLDSLVECSVVLEHDEGDQPVYSPDPLYTRFQTIRYLLNSHTREELIEIREELQAQIDEWRDEYDVDSPDALRKQATTSSSVVDSTEACQIARDWELAEYRRGIVAHLSSYYTTYTCGDRSHE